MADNCENELACGCAPSPWPTSFIPPDAGCIVYDQITPSIENGDPVYFAGGETLPAGTYKVRYVGGALKYNEFLKWALNALADNCFRVVFSNGAGDIQGPGVDYDSFDTQAELEAHNAGAEVEFEHDGNGPIGMFLLDEPYDDNIPGDPNPTFELSRGCA